MANVTFQDLPHVGNHHLLAQLKLVRPKPVGPLAVADIDAFQFYIGALGVVDDSLLLSIAMLND
jgi:hypothetical protein